jgi:hypothetical protein
MTEQVVRRRAKNGSTKSLIYIYEEDYESYFQMINEIFTNMKLEEVTIT